MEFARYRPLLACHVYTNAQMLYVCMYTVGYTPHPARVNYELAGVYVHHHHRARYVQHLFVSRFPSAPLLLLCVMCIRIMAESLRTERAGTLSPLGEAVDGAAVPLPMQTGRKPV